MKPLLLLPLLLGAVSALHLENDALSQDSRGTQADLSQDLEGSGEQKGELALTKDVIQSEGEEDKASRDPNAFEDEEDEADEDDEESETSDLAEDIQCPREEDTVHMLGSPGCMNCHYVLVRYPRWFKGARKVCNQCYRGNLASIHNFCTNHRIQVLTQGLNHAQVWIGGRFTGCRPWQNFCWIDGSSCNFSYWAQGQPYHGAGRCVSLGIPGGRWRRVGCKQRKPFICSY